MGRGLDGLRFDRNEEIDLTAQERAGYDVADFVFRLAVDGREAHAEIELLGVQRADLHRDLRFGSVASLLPKPVIDFTMAGR